MSTAHLLWLLTGSTLSPMILQLRLANSGYRPAMYPSSVVQTGVKSLGCENKMAQPLPIHSWKLMVPCEVSAVKLGASSFIRKRQVLLGCGALYTHRFDGSNLAAKGSAAGAAMVKFLPSPGRNSSGFSARVLQAIGSLL